MARCISTRRRLHQFQRAFGLARSTGCAAEIKVAAGTFNSGISHRGDTSSGRRTVAVADSNLALYHNRSAMFGHDVVHASQAQAGAVEPPDDIAGAITVFEDPRQLRGRNADAPVRHVDDGPGVRLLHGHHHRAIVAVVLERVVDEIGDGAFQAGGVPPAHQFRHAWQHHDMASAQAGMLAVSGDAPRKLHQIGRLPMEDAGGCAGLRLQVGEFAEQVSDAPGSFLDALQTVHQSGQLRSTLDSPTQQRAARSR